MINVATIALALLLVALQPACSISLDTTPYDHEAKVQAALAAFEEGMYVNEWGHLSFLGSSNSSTRSLLQAAVPAPPAPLAAPDDGIDIEAMRDARTGQQQRLDDSKSGIRGATIAAVGGAGAASFVISAAAASATAQAINVAVAGATSSAMESATELATTAVGGALGPVRIADIVSRVTMRSGVDGALMPLGLGDIIHHIQFFVLSSSLRIEQSSYQEELAKSLEWILFQINGQEWSQGHTSIYNVTRTIGTSSEGDVLMGRVRHSRSLLQLAAGPEVIIEPESHAEYIYKLAANRLMVILIGFVLLVVLHWLALILWHPVLVCFNAVFFVICCKNQVTPAPRKHDQWMDEEPMKPPPQVVMPTYAPPARAYSGSHAQPQQYNYPTPFPYVVPATPATAPEVQPAPTYPEPHPMAPMPHVPAPTYPEPPPMAPMPAVPAATFPGPQTEASMPPSPPTAMPPPPAPPMPRYRQPIRIDVAPSSSPRCEASLASPGSGPRQQFTDGEPALHTPDSESCVRTRGPVAESKDKEHEVITSQGYFSTMDMDMSTVWERAPIPTILVFPRLEMMYMDVALLGATQATAMLLCTGEVRYMWPAFIAAPIIILYFFFIASLLMSITRDQKYYPGMEFRSNTHSDGSRSFFMEWILFWRARGTWGNKTLNILHKHDKEPHRSKHFASTRLSLFFLIRLLLAHGQHRYEAKEAWETAVAARDRAVLRRKDRGSSDEEIAEEAEQKQKDDMDLMKVEKLQLLGYEVQERFGDLYEPFTEMYRGWKILEMAYKIGIASVTGVGVGLFADPRSNLALGLSASMLAMVLFMAVATTLAKPRVEALRGIAEFCCLWFEVGAMGLVLAMQLLVPPDAGIIEATLPSPPATTLQIARFACQLAAIACAVVFILVYGLLFKVIAFFAATKTLKKAAIAEAVAVHDEDERERARQERELQMALMREAAAQYVEKALVQAKEEAELAQKACIAAEATMATVLACTNAQAASEAMQALLEAMNDATSAARRAQEACKDAAIAANNADPGHVDPSAKELALYQAALETAEAAEAVSAEADASRLKCSEFMNQAAAHLGKLRSEELSRLQEAAAKAAAALAAEEERRLKEAEEEERRRREAEEAIARMEAEEAAKKEEEERLRREAQEAEEKRRQEEVQEAARKAAEAAEAARAAEEAHKREELANKRHEFIDGADAAADRTRAAATEAEKHSSKAEKWQLEAERMRGALEDQLASVDRRKKAAEAEPAGDLQAQLERTVHATEDARRMAEKAADAADAIKKVSDRAEKAAEAAEADVAKARAALVDAHNAAAWVATQVPERKFGPPHGTATEAELKAQEQEDARIAADMKQAEEAMKQAEEAVKQAAAAAKMASAAAVKSKVASKQAGRVVDEAKAMREQAEKEEEELKKVHAKAMNKMNVANAMRNTVAQVTTAKLAKAREEAKKRYEEEANAREEAERLAEADRQAKRDAARAGKKLPAYMRSTKAQKGLQKDPNEEAMKKRLAEEAAESNAAAALAADRAKEAKTDAAQSAFARLVFGAKNHVKTGGTLDGDEAGPSQPAGGSRITGGVAAYSFL